MRWMDGPICMEFIKVNGNGNQVAWFVDIVELFRWHSREIDVMLKGDERFHGESGDRKSFSIQSIK